MRKIIALLLSLLLLISVVSCNKNTTDEEDNTNTEVETSEENEEIERTVTLAYYSNDSLNPYLCSGVTNSSLTYLYCDSLFKVKTDYTSEPLIASGIVIQDNNAIVTLNEDIFFSDSSSLSGADVVYSFDLAKKSVIFSERLSNITSASFSGNTVTFRLKTPDAYCSNCLDFPIIKSGTGENNIPVGSGEYVLKQKKNRCSLSLNKNYSFDEEFSLSKIKLLDISTIKNSLYLIQIGTLTLVYDDLSKINEYDQHINTNKISINRNDLVYLGLNNSTLNSDMRKAISSLIDKDTLSQNAFDSNAEIANNLFNPSWNLVSNLNNTRKTDITLAEKYLKKAGYVIQNEKVFKEIKNDDDTENVENEQLQLTILVSKSDKRNIQIAKDVKSMISKIGIDVEVNNLSSDEYITALKKGYYDIYIGEVKLTANMDFSCFFDTDGSASYGISKDSASVKNYSRMKSGAMEVVTFVNIFNEDNPFIPICYKNGIAYYSRELFFEDTVCENNIYENIYSWKI